MKAAYISKTGGPEVIQYGDIAEPELGPGQVRVAVKAVSVNPIDTYIRAGANYWELPDPFVIGCDMAGEVIETAADTPDWQPGTRVWCTNQGLLGRQGTFAQQVVVDAQWLYPFDESVAFEDAASVALTGVTAHLGLFREANLQAGQTILVIGGTGGVGSMVVQMAKAAGARVITTAGSDEKAEACRQLGADVVIPYHQQDIQEGVLRATNDEGVHLFWETRREPDFDQVVGCLRDGGRMIIMAGREARPEFPVGPFYVKGCSVHGFVMFKATATEMAECGRDISQWLKDGKLKSQIGLRLPLSQAAEAHRVQEANTLHGEGTLAGKIVLQP